MRQQPIKVGNLGNKRSDYKKVHIPLKKLYPSHTTQQTFRLRTLGIPQTADSKSKRVQDREGWKGCPSPPGQQPLQMSAMAWSDRSPQRKRQASKQLRSPINQCSPVVRLAEKLPLILCFALNYFPPAFFSRVRVISRNNCCRAVH